MKGPLLSRPERLIESRNNGLVKRVRALHQRAARDHTSLYYVEGIRFVARAMHCHAWIETLVVCPALLRHPFAQKLVRRLQRADTPTLLVSREVLDSLALVDDPQGIGAIVRQRWDRLERVRYQGDAVHGAPLGRRWGWTSYTCEPAGHRSRPRRQGDGAIRKEQAHVLCLDATCNDQTRDGAHDWRDGESEPIGLILCGSKEQQVVDLLFSDPDTSVERQIKVAQYLLLDTEHALRERLAQMSAAWEEAKEHAGKGPSAHPLSSLAALTPLPAGHQDTWHRRPNGGS